MRRVAPILFALLPLPSVAQSDILPALHDVAGVAADDVLNVRAGPGTGFEAVGSLAPSETGIEAVEASEDGRWLRVNSGEGSGWVSARYLSRTGPDWAEGLPDPLRCFGTEPFWSLEVSGGEIEFSTPDAPSWSLPVEEEIAALGRPMRFAVVATDVTMVVTGGLCSDGMSNRLFGLSTDIVIDRGEGSVMVSGCCSIAP